MEEERITGADSRTEQELRSVEESGSGREKKGGFMMRVQEEVTTMDSGHLDRFVWSTLANLQNAIILFNILFP